MGSGIVHHAPLVVMLLAWKRSLQRDEQDKANGSVAEPGLIPERVAQHADQFVWLYGQVVRLAIKGSAGHSLSSECAICPAQRSFDAGQFQENRRAQRRVFVVP